MYVVVVDFRMILMADTGNNRVSSCILGNFVGHNFLVWDVDTCRQQWEDLNKVSKTVGCCSQLDQLIYRSMDSALARSDFAAYGSTRATLHKQLQKVHFQTAT